MEIAPFKHLLHRISFRKLSFKFRLTFWYSLFATLTFLIFIGIVYYSTRRELESSLDSAMLRVATSLDYIIQKKQRETQKPLKPAPQPPSVSPPLPLFRNDSLSHFAGPLPPQDDTFTGGIDPFWTEVYEHILLNPKNYLVQIADSTGQIVWKSANLRNHTLPVAQDMGNFPSNIPAHLFIRARWKDGTPMRVLFYRSPLLQITVAYATKEINSTLAELFSLILYLLPLLFFTSLAGGWLLASYSLRPIERITETAREITAKKLDQRIPEPSAEDEIAQLVKTLNQMIARLEASFDQIRKFTSDVSHELRTPLAILMGELELALRSKRSPEEYERILATSLEEVIRLSKLVQALLELSRAETGQIVLDLHPLNISDTLQEIQEDAEILADAKNITVKSNIDRNLYVLGDRNRLYQAFLNIIDNAIKYTPEGGAITLSARRAGQNVLIAVQDTGIGIPEDELPYVFQRFYRVDKARSRKIAGYGLGLAIVKWIIDAHGGQISIRSTLGTGTTVQIILPAIEPPKQQSVQSSSFHILDTKEGAEK